MQFEQFYLNCLAHASYLIGSGGIAAIVDPQRDIEIYLKAAEEHGLKIAHIFETHLHADFVSGHKELAQRTGAKIYIGERAGAKFPHVALRDGFSLQFGEVEIRALETPGHTPESTCLVIVDREKSADQAWAVLTGDTLFIGDVGRPDLAEGYTPQQLAGALYDSLHQKLLTLPDEVLVYPAHGAGSLCGRNMRADRFSTIGSERLTNAALQVKTRDDFIQELTTHLPPRPQYFAEDAAINREGAAALQDLPPLPALSPDDVREAQAHGYVLLDTRAGDDFARGHVPGSVNIGLGGQFASWAGTVLGVGARMIVIAESDEKAQEARLRLARVGIERVIGYLKNGVRGWEEAGNSLEKIPQITAAQLRERLEQLTVLDVRREPEWQSGHIEGAHWHALDDFPRALPSLDRDAPIAVHCKGGYRSIIAASLLRRAGFRNVTDVLGGYDGWVAESKVTVTAK
ncbi:MAG: MBL fold metallo-hydrolase [Acidobacteriia bacterium]|nr:MBL fold metallo-hydrolase [Terriglobia bacterium]